MNQNEQEPENSLQNQADEVKPEQQKSHLLLRTIAYSIAGVTAVAVAAPFALAGYAYLRTGELAGKTTKWAFDNPIKTIAGAAAGAGMYYAANNIDWTGVEEKVIQGSQTVTEQYYETKINTLEETLERTNLQLNGVEEQNDLLKQGASVIYEQYDPKLLLGIGAGSAVIGGLLGGFAGYSVKRKTEQETPKPRKAPVRESLRQL